MSINVVQVFFTVKTGLIYQSSKHCYQNL